MSLDRRIAKDKDDDSNERDPFTDRSFNFYDLSEDYGPSDRDIRHKVNVFTYAELPNQFLLNVRAQGRTAQPITTSPRVLNNVDRGRNWDRKDNKYFSLDWRLQRPFQLGRAQVIPSFETPSKATRSSCFDNGRDALVEAGL